MTTKATEHSPKYHWRKATSNCVEIISFDGTIIAQIMGRVGNGDSFDGTEHLDANTIVETFNVFTETGLTPRQLAEQRAELLEALEKVRCLMIEISCEGQPMTEAQAKQVVSTCHFAIAHATGK